MESYKVKVPSKQFSFLSNYLQDLRASVAAQRARCEAAAKTHDAVDEDEGSEIDMLNERGEIPESVFLDQVEAREGVEEEENRVCAPNAGDEQSA